MSLTESLCKDWDLGCSEKGNALWMVGHKEPLGVCWVIPLLQRHARETHEVLGTILSIPCWICNNQKKKKRKKRRKRKRRTRLEENKI